MAEFGKPGEPEPLIPKISQETLAEMIGTTRSRVSFFMNRFRKLGFVEYDAAAAPGVARAREAMVGVYGWYPSRYGVKDALRMGNYSLLESAGTNIALEFLYEGPLFGDLLVERKPEHPGTVSGEEVAIMLFRSRHEAQCSCRNGNLVRSCCRTARKCFGIKSKIIDHPGIGLNRIGPDDKSFAIR